jgi:hypothetical protein
MSEPEELQDNIGWWGTPLNPDTKEGIIVWSMRDFKNPCPKVGSVIVDKKGNRYFGFKVISIADTHLGGSDYYLTVTPDGREYFPEVNHEQ